ncbi:MAG: DUF4292 domain-containing protein [Bacteroidia bacterium]
MKRIGIIILLGLTIWSCGGRKAVNLVDLNDMRMAQFWSNQLDYNYLSLKARLNITDKGVTTNVTTNIRMKKDSIMWASFSLVGFEGARVLVTNDSFKMINRLNNTYMVRGVDYLKYYLGFDVKLSEIQDIMLGNAPFPEEIYSLIFTDSVTRMQAQKGSIVNNIGVNDKMRNLISEFNSTEHIQSAKFTYLEYKNLGGKLVPNEVIADINMGNQASSAKLNYQTLDDEVILSFPFNIPKSFKRI